MSHLVRTQEALLRPRFVWFLLAFTACGPAGATTDDGGSDAASESSIETSEVGVLETGVDAVGTEVDGDAGDGAASVDGGDSFSDAITDAVTDGTGDADAAIPVSIRCGDGVRGSDEECDEGTVSGDGGDATVSSRALCTDACRVVDLLAVAPSIVDAGPSPAARTLGLGRHPLAGSGGGGGSFAVAFVEPDASPVRVSLTAFDAHGVASDRVTSFSVGSTAVLAANPVLGALDDGTYVVAWTDFDGDGDELGIAMRIVDPASPSSTVPLHANTTTSFSQYDPDVLVLGSQVVVAWVDDSSATTGSDVKVRTFDRHLTPTSAEQPVATTTASEADIALAPFAGSWAIAWKSASGGLESLVVKAGTTQWQTEAYLPGPSTSRPAVTQLDATHLLAVFAAARPDTSDAGVSSGYEIRAALFDMAAPGVVTSVVVPVTSGASADDRRDPNLVVVSGRLFIAWRAAAIAGDKDGDELWVKEVVWTGGGLPLSTAEFLLPRSVEHRLGDQRHSALLSVPIPGGEALVGAWDDLGKTFGLSDGNGDVVVEKAPVPVLRLGGS